MNHHPFLRGIGLGALAGAAIAIGLTMKNPKNRSAVKQGARRAGLPGARTARARGPPSSAHPSGQFR